MAEVSVAIKTVEGNRTSDQDVEGSQVTYDVNAVITEAERGYQKLSLKFNIKMGTQPPVATLTVSGTATLAGEDVEMDALLVPKEKDMPPPVFMMIYQKVYSVLYLLCGSMKIPYPSPGLLKTVEVSAVKEVSAAPVDEAGGQKMQV
ncbi:MAG: hypothetical protein JRN29_05480 [Nitrososphaerota archaeon]|nr:hypothetical protein [Nitrososphaerota archaeon]